MFVRRIALQTPITRAAVSVDLAGLHNSVEFVCGPGRYREPIEDIHETRILVMGGGFFGEAKMAGFRFSNAPGTQWMCFERIQGCLLIVPRVDTTSFFAVPKLFF
jgi:hypothetical protein